MKRKCKACPPDVQTVCRYVFGKFWGDKSTNGEGCDSPLDDVAEAWYARGWKPEGGETVSVTLRMPVRPKMPTRPKVSAAIMRQAELFFSGILSSGGCREAGASKSTHSDDVPTGDAPANFCEGGAA